MSDMEQLLELNIISAQDLAPVTRHMRTYAVVWVHSGRKLSTRIDSGGHTNPTWNDKFVFRVDPNFMSNEMSTINVEIYAVHWFRNIRVGSVRLFIGNVFPPSDLRRRNRHGTRFVALQVWRPSGRPQGILNVGASVLDPEMRGLRLYRQLSASAVGFKDLIDDNNILHNILRTEKIKKSDRKPVLIRSRSDRSELERKPTLELEDGLFVFKSKVGSGIGFEAPNEPKLKRVVSISTTGSGFGVDQFTGKNLKRMNKPKSRSLLSGSTNNESIVNYNKPWLKSNQTKSRLSVMSMSELGPSPSEIVEEVRRRNPTATETETSEQVSMLDESEEGLRSKMNRWRYEFEPVNEKMSSNSDRGTFTSNARTKHMRRHTDGGSGLFSCFGNVCGYECTVVCGRPIGPEQDGNDRSKS